MSAQRQWTVRWQALTQRNQRTRAHGSGPCQDDHRVRSCRASQIIHQIFPNARIIHCRRNPLDTCFSAYSKLFAGDFGFTYEQRELGIYYQHYHGLMAHWRSVLPQRIFMDIDYEALVSAPRDETRRLLQFLDLPWNEACMRFFENSRIVNTASFAQVRRPIYRSCVGRTDALRPHLQPLIEALGDLAPSNPKQDG